MEISAWIDIAVVALTLILGVKGIINGLIKELFGLIGLIGGLVIATRFSDVAEKFINENIYKFDNGSTLQFVAFVSLWIVFWLICLLIGKFLAKMLALSGLGFLDRLGGFVVGSAKIFLTFAAVLAVASGTGVNSLIEPYVKDSKIYPVLLSAGKWITNIDVKKIANDIDVAIQRPKDMNKTDALISMDENATETNMKKGE
ncbi:CvpA family protein [uncultured Campylobacter sp.]|uniref:CvpA family protein n=1 Tax=uncultured Campylobacter sp. TaxID=218934 RepID=UPI0025E44C6E|nr:CvpA family protein [uncultured Campylobacter sp.]